MHKIHVLALSLLAQFCPVSAGDFQPANPDPKEIARLVKQLGSEDGKAQEAAALALKKIGTPALELLRKATTDKDSAMSDRAKMLAKMLQPHASQVWCNYAGPWGDRFWDLSYGVESVAFSPDGRHVASAGGSYGNIKLWDVATGDFVRRFEPNDRWMRRLVFSHDGRYLAAVSLFDPDEKEQNSAFYVWETASAKLVHRFKGSRLGWSVAFSNDDKQLITGGKEVRWWDLKTGKESKTLQLKGFPHFWGLSSDGRYVMANKENPQNFYAGSLIDLSTGKEVVHFPFGLEGESGPESVAYSPDGKSLLFTTKLRLRDTQSGKEIVAFGWRPAANAVAISANGLRALSAHGETLGKGELEFNWQCAVRLWDMKTGKEQQRFIGHRNPVRTVAFSPDGRYAASGSDYGTLRLWKLPE